MENRWRIVNSARKAVLDLTGPTYLLDANFHFLDWNPAFDEVVAKPLRLLRGTRGEFYYRAGQLAGSHCPRPIKVSGEPGNAAGRLRGAPYQDAATWLDTFRKIAVQIAETSEHGLVWSVHLNIERAENADLLWEDLERRLTAETNWSRYADRTTRCCSTSANTTNY